MLNVEHYRASCRPLASKYTKHYRKITICFMPILFAYKYFAPLSLSLYFPRPVRRSAVSRRFIHRCVSPRSPLRCYCCCYSGSRAMELLLLTLKSAKRTKRSVALAAALTTALQSLCCPTSLIPMPPPKFIRAIKSTSFSEHSKRNLEKEKKKRKKAKK